MSRKIPYLNTSSNFPTDQLQYDTTRSDCSDTISNKDTSLNKYSSSLSSPDEEPRESKGKSSYPGHGNRFQVKLLMLLWIRAMSVHGASFYVGYQKPDVDQKSDDVIIYFRDSAKRNQGKNKTKQNLPSVYQFLQAKHRLNERNKIIADQLLDIPKENDFSLPKYFRSYLAISRRGDSIKNYLLCTNVGFNENNLQKNGIELKPVQQRDHLNISEFGFSMINNKKPTCYKFKVTDNLRISMHKSVNGCTNDEIEGFFDKFKFTVNMPNESELDDLLTREIGTRLQVPNADTEYCTIVKEMVKWFKGKDNTCLSAEEGTKLFIKKTEEIMALRHMLSLSSVYQSSLKEVLGFNSAAIDKFADRLKLLFENSSKQIERITSLTPDFMAVKIISALEKLSADNKDNYLVIPSTYIQEIKKELDKALNAENSPIRLVIVVKNLNDNSYCEKLVTNPAIKIFLIGPGDTHPLDPVNYLDLSEKTKKVIKSREVLFQGTYTTVKILIGENTNLEDVINFPSIKELLISENQSTIPALNPHYCNLSGPYIPRRITFPYKFNDEFWDCLSKELKTSKNKLKSECNISAHSNIEWLINDESRISEIWQGIKTVLKMGNNKTTEVMNESVLIGKQYKSRIVILTGEARTGKSTVLHSFYHQIISQQSSPKLLVIRLDFTDENIKALLQIDFFPNVIDFLIHILLLSAVGNSPFTQLLIRNRLKTSGGIVLMVDGFDEIDGQLQDKALRFMKAILQTKLDRLYVTTRPQLNDKLQDGFFQFTYKLENFCEKDQVYYICNYWTTEFQVTSKIQSFAKLLIKKVEKTLSVKERGFIGIPLQCRILAECFARRIKEVLHKGTGKPMEQILDDLIKGNKFDLRSLYAQLIETKKQIFREKQMINVGHFLTDYVFPKLLLRLITGYHTKLALRSIVSDSVALHSLWPPSSSFESEIDKEANKRDIEDSALMFGLTFNNHNKLHDKIEFVHRTFAEYLVAKYFYEGLLPDDKTANKLLKQDCNLQYFYKSILILVQYDGVRTFLNSMLQDIVESEEWCNMVKQKSLPERFQKFSCEILSRTVEYGNSTYRNKVNGGKIVTFILEAALWGKHSNIFRFVTDCLDATQDTRFVKCVMCEIFDRVTPSCADQSRKVFQRFLFSYKDTVQPDVHHVERIVRILPPNTTYTTDTMYSWDKKIPFSYWNQEETKANVELALNFLLQNAPYLEIRMLDRSDALFFFICNEYYNSLVPKFVELLSETCDDESLIRIFIEVLSKNKETSYNLLYERIPQFLIMLQKFQRHNVVKNLARRMLMTAPNAFEKVYIIPFDDDASDGNLSIRPNPLGFTRLHKAAFKRGSVNTIRGFITNYGLSKDELVNLIKNKDLSPLCVAAASKNKDAFYEMLSFLKKELTAKQLLLDFAYNRPDGFLFRALLDAIRYKNIEMFKLIITQNKEVLGQDGLLALLCPHDFARESVFDDYYEAKNAEYKWLEPSDVLIEVCRNRDFMRAMAEILDNGYEKLNEFLFKKDYGYFDFFHRFRGDIVETFGNENLLGMIQAENGFSNWLKLVLGNTDLQTGFSAFTEESFLNYLTNNELVSEFVGTIISTCSKREEAKKEKMSYWAESFSDQSLVDCFWFEEEEDDNDHSSLDRFLNCVSKEEYGQKILKELVSHNQYKFISEILMERRNGVLEVMFAYLSQDNRNDVCAQIFHNFSTMTASYICRKISNVIWFLSHHYESDTEYVIYQNVLSKHDCQDVGKPSIWSIFIQLCDNNKKAVKSYDFLVKLQGEENSPTKTQTKYLLLHDNGSGVVLFEDARHSTVGVLLKYLNEADKNEVCQQILQEGYQIHEVTV